MFIFVLITSLNEMYFLCVILNIIIKPYFIIENSLESLIVNAIDRQSVEYSVARWPC